MPTNPAVVNVIPAPNATDIVLGTDIIVTFSEPINTDSFNNATFTLVGPSQTAIVTPQQLVEEPPDSVPGRGFILGTYAFSTVTLSTWVAGYPYVVGNAIVDSNGNLQTVTQAGTSSPYAPTWSTVLGNSTTDNDVPNWQTTTYSFGNYILDPNGNLQKCTVAGTTGSTIPTFNMTLSGTTFDNQVTWTNYGPLNPVVWLNGGIANSNRTTATFTPSAPLLPGQIYTCLVVGKDSVLATNYVEDVSGNPVLTSYQWSFTTGTLNLTTPPIQNPIASNPISMLTADQIQVIPRPPVGNDLTQQIELVFPAAIDTNTFDPTQLLIGIEPILNDPDVMVPMGATASYIVQGNKIIVTLTGVA